jgi:excisionase family DNA binding protein
MNETVLTQKDAYRLMLKEYPDVVNLEQMCEILGISTKTGYKLLKEKKIDALKVGRAYRIPKLHILSYLKIGSESSKEN